MVSLIDTLKTNSYPGRGIVIGRADETHIRIFYFIMGRSENSRNRIFAYTEDGIRTEAREPEKMTDPSLVIYHPVRLCENGYIVTNGDQTDTIRDAVANGGSFRDALMTRTFEPDPPIFTPRISGIVYRGGGFELSILKSADGDGSFTRRCFFRYDAVPVGTGLFISTYQCNGDPPPSFAGEPVCVDLPEADEVWDALDPENKVALYSCLLDVETFDAEEDLYNR